MSESGHTVVELCLFMDFSKRLVGLRKERNITQMEFAKQIGVHVTQLRRYEAGTSLPTFEVLRAMARALRVSADVLLFGDAERGPDQEFRPHFDAISRLSAHERQVIKDVLEGLLLKHDAKRWAAG